MFSIRTWTITIVVALVILGMFFVPGISDLVRKAVFGVTSPVRKGTSAVTDGTGSFFSSLINLKSVYQENTELKTRVEELESALAADQDKLSSYETLKVEVGLKSERQVSPIACHVLHLDLDASALTAVLDCGSEQGVIVGQIAVSGDYVAGRVVYVGNTTSTLLLAVSSQFTVDAKIARSGSDAVVKGSYNSGLLLDLVPKNEELRRGDLVTVAGLTSPGIKGVLIGTVADLVSGSAELFTRASLQSPVKFKSLDHVLILP